jgi:hypothetical protein
VPVGVTGIVVKDGVKVASTVTKSPFASVVVYVYGVGPPGVRGVVPGCPTTGPCWLGVVVVRVLVVVGVVPVVVGVVVGEVLVAVVDVPCPKVCSVCVSGWPKAFVVTCSTMVTPAGFTVVRSC